MDDQYDPRRFLDAQSPIYDEVRSELLAGHKRTHWMWFVFPQIAGLGNSATSRRFAISSLDEAKAFLEHPVLGARLRDCTRILNGVEGRSAYQIFGDPDCSKFHSCMTLFSQADVEEELFSDALNKYFDGELDSRTLDKL